MALGADCVIQSTHKTLSALTQAAMLHVKGPALDRGRISRALQLLQVHTLYACLTFDTVTACLLQSLP